MRFVLLALTCGAIFAGIANAQDAETGGRVHQRKIGIQRKTVFEFAQPPAIRRLEGDRCQITFASKDFCDVTVAVEVNGRIVRHLACGLLGPTAPAPLVRDSLVQTIEWDGKDDWGKYVDQPGAAVRVSLGLDLKFDYVTSDCSPYNNVGTINAFATDADGVYVVAGSYESNVRKFDHDGNYVCTIYPFPPDKVGLHRRDPAAVNKFTPISVNGSQIDSTHGLPFQTYPDGLSSPLKQYGQFGQYAGIYHGGEATLFYYSMTVSRGRIVLPSHGYGGFVYFGTDGGPAGDLPLFGPQPVKLRANETQVPFYTAASPDGQWLYFAGVETYDPRNPNQATWLHAVYRIPITGECPPMKVRETFVGEGTSASDMRDGLNKPAGLATDPAGRLFVCDYGNNRLSVFTADGKWVANIPVPAPRSVAVNPKTGEVYVLSITRQPPRAEGVGRCELIKLRSVEKPDVLIRQEFEWSASHMFQPMMAMDFWAKEPTAWLLLRGHDLTWHVERDGKFERHGSLFDRAGKLTADVPRLFARPAEASPVFDPMVRARAFYDPVRNKMYRADGPSFYWMRRYDAATGRLEAMIRMPVQTEDVAFDGKGLMYLRETVSHPTRQYVGRFNPETMEEAPFDYGEPCTMQYNRKFTGGIVAPMMSLGRFHDCGLAVSQKGDVYVFGVNARITERNLVMSPSTGTINNITKGREALVAWTYKWDPNDAFAPAIYPGRLYTLSNIVFVYDHGGQLKLADAIKGVTHASRCIGTDRSGNIFIGTCDTGVVNGQPYGNPFWGDRGVVYKFPPAGGRFLVDNAQPAKLTEPPNRPYDVIASAFCGQGKMWAEGVDWFFPGASSAGHVGCRCQKYRFAVDYFGRVFVPEADRYSISVLDNSGMVITRVGRYANADSAGAGSRAALGGDEIGLATCDHLAVDTDHRLFGYDRWNKRMLGLKIVYHAQQVVPVPQK